MVGSGGTGHAAASLKEMLAQIAAAEATSKVTSRQPLSDVSDLKASIRQFCDDGNIEEARRLTGLAISMLRTGDAAKE